jgi:hypothetical protein
MKPNEFFNSTENLNDLVNNNGLLVSPEALLLYRKALGHSCEFDCSIIYNTSQTILNPLGRPVRRTQVPAAVKHAWNRMNQVILLATCWNLSGPGEDPGAGRRGEPGRHLAADLARRAQHPHAAQPLHRLPHGPVAPGAPGRPQPIRTSPTAASIQPLPGPHARRLSPFFAEAGSGNPDALPVRLLQDRPDRLSPGSAQLGDHRRRELP